MHSRIYKGKMVLILLLTLIFTGLQAQYVIEGAKYKSIRDSLLGNKNTQNPIDVINSITINYTLSGPQLYSLNNKMRLQKAKSLKNNYQSKKIKEVLLDHQYGKAVLVLKGKDSICITEDLAIKEGILAESSFNESQVIKVDSPLYVNKINPVYIKLQHPENNLVSKQLLIKPTGVPYEYELESYLPGDGWIIETDPCGNTKMVYAFTSVPDPDQVTSSADFFVGNLNSLIVDYDFFKKQEIMTASKGYRFSSGTVYFAELGAMKVKSVTLAGPSLGNVKLFMNLCLPGSTIMFDNVELIDSSGQKLTPVGKSYYLVDKNDIRPVYSVLISTPYFDKGTLSLYSYLIETLVRLPGINLKKGIFDFDFSFIVEADGSLTDIYMPDFIGKDEIYQACYKLVKYSNGWVPGSYKGINIRMPSEDLHFSVVIK